MIISATGTAISASSEQTSKRCSRWCTAHYPAAKLQVADAGLELRTSSPPIPYRLALVRKSLV